MLGTKLPLYIKPWAGATLPHVERLSGWQAPCVAGGHVKRHEDFRRSAELAVPLDPNFPPRSETPDRAGFGTFSALPRSLPGSRESTGARPSEVVLLAAASPLDRACSHTPCAEVTI
jgi:hypothetical protein